MESPLRAEAISSTFDRFFLTFQESLFTGRGIGETLKHILAKNIF